MASDYWHLVRFFRLVGAGDDDTLPFGAPPLVIGPLVTMREPVWRSARATLVAHGTPDVFDSWVWDKPLQPSAAARLLHNLDQLIADVESTGVVLYSDDLAEDDRPHPRRVIAAIQALRNLLVEAVSRSSDVETWVN